MAESRSRSRVFLRIAVFIAAAVGAVLLYRYIRSMPGEVQAAFENAPELEIISLDPAVSLRGGKPIASVEYFQNWKVLGRAKVTDPAARARLISGLNRAIAEHFIGVMACFEPRHVLRAVHDGAAIDAVICFECRHVWFYRDGGRIAADTVSESVEPFFDDIFQAAGLPKAAATR